KSGTSAQHSAKRLWVPPRSEVWTATEAKYPTDRSRHRLSDSSSSLVIARRRKRAAGNLAGNSSGDPVAGRTRTSAGHAGDPLPVPVDLDLAINQPLSDPVEVAAYYVVAEALTNAAKHAQASEVAVSAHSRGARLHVSVRDNGVGGAQLGKGSGLIGLKDRLDTLGGTIRLVSPLGGGTSLDATIPLNVGSSSR
ncbi:MAG: hypothetical protein QOE74_3949, partial [Mycobacterium sp.]|nr:hypothetical protein [Mycobacterium sp.]